ncbi:MAG: septal ring lytic transglycosylase RlpA family protein [Desulfobulbus sp.]|jgi:rare lipoprotein A
MHYTPGSPLMTAGPLSNASRGASAVQEKHERDTRLRIDSRLMVRSSFQDFLAESVAVRRERQPEPAEPPPDEVLHTVKRGDTIWELARRTYHVDPDVLMRHNGITDPGSLRIGSQLRIPGQGASKRQASVKRPAPEVIASWYGRPHHGRLMANGEPFDMHAATVAHRKLPLGVKVELENPATGDKTMATVTDRGPYIKGRDLDLSYGVAKRLSMVEQGVARLRLRVL